MILLLPVLPVYYTAHQETYDVGLTTSGVVVRVCRVER